MIAFPLIAQMYRILLFHYLKVCMGIVSKIPSVVSRIESSLHSFCDTHGDACQLQLELKTMFNVDVYAYFVVI